MTSPADRPALDLAAELAERFAARTAETTRRKHERAGQRRQFAAARDAGLQKRHADKLGRQP